METKFTPAPWVVWGSDIGVVDRSDSQSNGMMLQVAYADMYNFGDDIGENNETGKANAHLIAAAPEMYEMLSYFIILVEKDSSEDFLYKFNEIKELLSRARGE